MDLFLLLFIWEPTSKKNALKIELGFVLRIKWLICMYKEMTRWLSKNPSADEYCVIEWNPSKITHPKMFAVVHNNKKKLSNVEWCVYVHILVYVYTI